MTNVEETHSAVAVDEAFMIKGSAEVLIWLFRMGFDVLVSSLDLDALGKSFGEIRAMMPWATHVEKCAAVCTICGADAYYSYKKSINEDEMIDGTLKISVGAADMYEARCYTCHPGISLKNS
jgi:thymidine kinase